MMKDTIYFDMDGTIVDFYSVPNWLQNLEKNQTKPYRIAKPIQKNYDLVKKAILKGYKIGIISWGSKNCNENFLQKITAAKLQWLARYFPFASEIHIVPYGTNKRSVAADKNGWLIDDEQKNLDDWGEKSIHASSMITFLENLE